MLAVFLVFPALIYNAHTFARSPENQTVSLIVIGLLGYPSCHQAQELTPTGQVMTVTLTASLNVSGSRPSRRRSSTDATAHSPLFTASDVVAHCSGTSPGHANLILLDHAALRRCDHNSQVQLTQPYNSKALIDKPFSFHGIHTPSSLKINKSPMTLPNPPQPQPLTFPALTFAKLSPAAFLNAHLTHPTGPLRPSGRTPTQTRPPTYNAGSLTHANGSAVVRCGDTAAVCGIRAEVLKVADVADYNNSKARKVDDEVDGGREGGREEEEEEQRRKRRERKIRRDDTAEMASLNLLVPNLELATGCSPAHLPGGPPSLLAQTLTQRILTLLHTSNLIGMEPLRIWFRPAAETTTTRGAHLSGAQRRRMGGDMGVMAMKQEDDENDNEKDEDEDEEEGLPKAEIKAFWTLYIDILFISLDGNAFDAAWFALLAALNDTLLPKAWWDPDREMVLCSDDAAQATRLDLRGGGFPTPLSFGVFEGMGEGGEEGGVGKKGKEVWVLVDTDGFEEALCKEQGTVVVVGGEGGGGRIVRVEKSGGVGVGMDELRGLVRLALKRREEWLRVLGVQ